MKKSKLGKGVDDIFATKKNQEPKPTAAVPNEVKAPEPKEKQGRGRPQEHSESWTKVTVVLLESQIDWLDHLSLDIRHNTKTHISRAEIIRAAISVMQECGIDFKQSTSEEELKTLLLTSLKAK